jgi:PAS domain-containing protein
MSKKDKQPEDVVPSADATGLPQAESFRISSEQAGQTLRWLAEDIFRRKASLPMEGLKALPPEEMQHMLHELRVHQIELEIQNEELRRIQEELAAAKDRYFDLYDLAPVGYCTLSKKGLILEANLTAATMLGVARAALIQQPLSRFILKADQDIYYLLRKQLFEAHSALQRDSAQEGSMQTGEPQACELRMVKEDGTVFRGILEATVRQEPAKRSGKDADGQPPVGNLQRPSVIRVVISDITREKQAEEALQKALNDDIRTLRGILPICANCKKIRDDQGYWSQVEEYIRLHTEVQFSHGICPECVKKLYPGLKKDTGGTTNNK